MSAPHESYVELPAGRFRMLTWGEGDRTALFLHGLTAVSEVWGPTIEDLPRGRRYIALDQRYHGRSPRPSGGYSASALAADVRALAAHVGAPIDLVGHSMGARIAIVAAARWPSLFRSVAVVDIGPEASKANIAATVAGLASRPERFASRDDALAFAFRSRVPTSRDAAIFLARLEEHPDGSLAWLSSAEDLAACVRAQRSRNYWAEWRSLAVPALFVHGGASNEVSASIAGRMLRENARVQFERLEGIGHNIPLIAPAQLAALLRRHWTTAGRSAT